MSRGLLVPILVASLPAPGVALAQDPAARVASPGEHQTLGVQGTPARNRLEPGDLQVILLEREPLKLVEMSPGPRRPTVIELQGTLEIHVMNKTDHPLDLQNLQVHGLVFTDRKTRKEHVLVHACQCIRDVQDPHRAFISLPPHERDSFTLDAFGCDVGPFPPPAPGDYEVRYRVLPQPKRPHPKEAADAFHPDARQAAKSCRETLQRRSHWASAIASPPLRVTLTDP